MQSLLSLPHSFGPVSQAIITGLKLPGEFFDRSMSCCYWLLWNSPAGTRGHCRHSPPKSLSHWRFPCAAVSFGRWPDGALAHQWASPHYKSRPMRVADMPSPVVPGSPSNWDLYQSSSMPVASRLPLGIVACAPYFAAPHFPGIDPQVTRRQPS